MEMGGEVFKNLQSEPSLMLNSQQYPHVVLAFNISSLLIASQIYGKNCC